MKPETMTLEPTSYELSGCPFLLPHDLEIQGRNRMIEWLEDSLRLRNAMRAKYGDFDIDTMLAETIEELFGEHDSGGR